MMPATAESGDLRLVVFDVDGTLVDSQHNIIEAMRMACAAVGLAAPSDEVTRSVIGLSLGEAVAQVTPGASEPDRRRVETSYKEAFATLRLRPNHHEPLFPGVHAVLDALEAAGCLLGLATGKSRRGVASVIERHGLEGRFVTVRTADDGPGKPHPAMMREAMAEAGVEPDSTAMVGDTTFDMEMARAAGADPVGVSWGYHPPTALMEAGARLVLPDFSALPGCLSWSAEPAPCLAARA